MIWCETGNARAPPHDLGLRQKSYVQVAFLVQSWPMTFSVHCKEGMNGTASAILSAACVCASSRSPLEYYYNIQKLVGIFVPCQVNLCVSSAVCFSMLKINPHDETVSSPVHGIGTESPDCLLSSGSIGLDGLPVFYARLPSRYIQS